MAEKMEHAVEHSPAAIDPAPSRRRRHDSRVVPGDGNRFLDLISAYLEAPNDAALCMKLEVLPSLISKIRHGRSVGVLLLIRIHEVTDIPVKTLRALLAGEEVSL